jgi:hypothetical protein
MPISTPTLHCLLLTAWAATCHLAPLEAQPAKASTGPLQPFFELRTYYAAPGKMDELQTRFREHTLAIFQNHGMTNVGYWVPVENTESKLIYLLSFPNREAREKSWREFFADPEWQKVQKASEANGKLVAKVDSLYLKPTDYSPALKIESSNQPRLFELRTYKAAPGKLEDLHRRFREKTLPLFDQHGMANIGYWVPVDSDKGADDTLIYILAHASKAVADQSWKAFRDDPAWNAARKASELNGPLTTANGVKSVYLQPTDYSPLK